MERGTLRCQSCATTCPIRGFIPRFVPDDGYAEGFGLEWNMHRRTQYDEKSGVPLSRQRFFDETGWPDHLDGEVVIEAGSGSGRFTHHALSTGATVLSLDYSSAVDANYASNGHAENLLLVQGDIFQMPFAPEAADRLFCFGVLQHTPDPEAAFRSLVRHVRPGGHMAVDAYIKTVVRYNLNTKYWVRPITRRIPPRTLYKATSRYVELMWPVARRVRRIPKIGKALNWRLLIGDYSDVITDDEVLRDWAQLDTFDMLSPMYDQPIRISTARRWCEETGLVAVRVQRRYGRVEIHARRAPA